ncbi:MAG: DOMON domain-containing protein [Candidatus Hodarchaeota archaeon]
MFILLISCLLTFESFTNSPEIRGQVQQNVLDGVISNGEYNFNSTFANGDYILYWQNIGNEIYFGIVGKTMGWVALGIDPILMMQDADMIFGWINSTGDIIVIDAFATGLTGPHPPDTDLGGTDNILEFNGTEINEVTTIEFKRLLSTDDEYDKDIPSSGTVKILWAFGTSDSFGEQHVKRGSAQLSLLGAAGFQADFFSPLILGTALIIGLVGFLIFVDSFGRRLQEAYKEKQGGSD